MDYSLPGSSVHGILQVRILLFLSPGDLPDPGIKPGSPALQEDCLPPELPGKQVHTRTQNEMQKPGGRMQITQDKDPTS